MKNLYVRDINVKQALKLLGGKFENKYIRRKN